MKLIKSFLSTIRYGILIALKLLLILDILTLIAMCLRGIVYKGISGAFVLSRLTGEVCQFIDFKMYFKIKKNDYYKNRKSLIKEITQLNFEKLKKVSNGKIIHCKTNTMVEKILKRNIATNNIIEEKYYEDRRQVSEKLSFIRVFIVWKNINNKEFWRFIFRKEKVRKYYFIL